MPRFKHYSYPLNLMKTQISFSVNKLFQSVKLNTTLACVNTVPPHLDTFPRDEGLSAAGGYSRGRGETASRWRRRRGLGGLLCAIPRHRELVCGRKNDSGTLRKRSHTWLMSSQWFLKQATRRLWALHMVCEICFNSRLNAACFSFNNTCYVSRLHILFRFREHFVKNDDPQGL